jgi:benzoyl-CoA-dihydrodiol lyase
MGAPETPQAPVSFETHPSKYIHWKLSVEGPVARLLMDVQEERPMRPGYALKTNSYDLGVDIELADAIERLRFEHPEVRCLVVGSAKDRIFCSGANIYMLGSSTHGFKVNFCKFTNETRLYLEEASQHSGLKSIAAVSGACAGGGYELALACDEILLVDDSSSAVSLPEVPLLAVLPGTGGLTRVVDKRKVRRDLADVFSSLGEGVKGRRAVSWNLVDKAIPLSKFDAALKERAAAVAATAEVRKGPGVTLPGLKVEKTETASNYGFVSASFDASQRVATITVKGPTSAPVKDAPALRAAGASQWHFQMARELDDVLLDLRFNRPEIGVIVLKTTGDAAAVRAHDAALLSLAEGPNADWFAKEIVLKLRRVFKRLDLTARSLLAVIDDGSCFAGTLAELAFAADRSYMLDADPGPAISFSAMNAGPLPMSNGLTRLQTRFLGSPDKANVERDRDYAASDALDAGLVTFTPDDIDWEDEVRLAIEERASLSPDALTGMEANLRFAGPETMETKIFGRLSAWQNWIFQRPNAVGEHGALTLYGKPERARFNWTRT